VLAGTLRDALAQIHDQGIAHGDIEMRNIMVDGNDGLDAKFIDFGNSVVLADDGSNAGEFDKAKHWDWMSLGNVLAGAEAFCGD
jgi:serine/threonine protein kinase